MIKDEIGDRTEVARTDLVAEVPTTSLSNV